MVSELYISVLMQYSAFNQDTSTTKEEIAQVVNPDDKRVTGANIEVIILDVDM